MEPPQDQSLIQLDRLLAIEQAARELIKTVTPFEYCEEAGYSNGFIRCSFCERNGNHHYDTCPWLRLERACEEGE